MRKITLFLMAALFVAAPGVSLAGLDLGEVDIHGFVSQGYVQSSDYGFHQINMDQEELEDGSYEFSEVGLNFSSTVSDNLRLGVQLLSKDMGTVGNNEVVVDWAYADYNFKNWLGLRVGKVKRAIGLFNEYQDIDATRTSIFLPPIYREDWREGALAIRGAAIYGTLPGSLEYNISYGIADMSTEGGVAKTMERTVGGKVTDIDSEPNYTAWLKWNTPLNGLSLTASQMKIGLNMEAQAINSMPLSALTGLPAHAALNLELKTPITNKTTVFYNTVATQYFHNNLMVAAEYQWGKEVLKTKVMGIPQPTKKNKTEIWSLLTTYRFTPLFELGVCYSEEYDDRDDRDGDAYVAKGLPKENAWRKDLAISTRFDITNSWIFKLEAHLMDGLLNIDYGTDPSPDENWEMYAAKLTYIF